jgi:hypothetical protein
MMAGFLYLALVRDAWGRRIVGWAIANHLRAELIWDTMEIAVGQRRPRNVIRHSDRGRQYTSATFGKRCGEAGVRPSMGSLGDAGACPWAGEAGPGDNAMAESFDRFRAGASRRPYKARLAGGLQDARDQKLSANPAHFRRSGRHLRPRMDHLAFYRRPRASPAATRSRLNVKKKVRLIWADPYQEKPSLVQ